MSGRRVTGEGFSAARGPSPLCIAAAIGADTAAIVVESSGTVVGRENVVVDAGTVVCRISPSAQQEQYELRRLGLSSRGV